MNNVTQDTSNKKSPKLIRFTEVHEKTGLSRSTIWNLEQSGNFPERIILSTRAVGWYEHEIDAWVDDLKENMLNAERAENGALKENQLWSASDE